VVRIASYSASRTLALAAALALSSLFPTAALAEPAESTEALPEVTIESAPTSEAAAAYPANLVQLEAELLERTNAERAARGFAPLAHDPALTNVARTRAAAQVPLPSLSHYDASGQLAVGKLLAAEGVTYKLAGENLARLPGADNTTSTRATKALMDSPLHRKNILEPRFDRMAIGAVLDPNGRVIYAQIFRGA
jgi:uncharacterized protein YkwD